MKIKKTVIIAGYKCNNHCKFCYNDAKRRHLPARTTADILWEIRSARWRGATYLELIGGELTLRPDILEILFTAKKIGFRNISITTNGRLFSYRKFARKVIEAGLTDLVFSIHGHCAKLHDSLTRVNGSFRQLCAGVANVKKIGGCSVGSNTTIVKQNFRFLPEIGRYIYDLGIRNSEFIFVDPTMGFARKNFKTVVPKISLAAPYIRRCLDIGRLNKVPHWNIRYVPLCHFLDYESQISEIYELKTFIPEHIAPDFENFNVAQSRSIIARIKPPICRACSKYDTCEGIWREYYLHYGGKELIPIK